MIGCVLQYLLKEYASKIKILEWEHFQLAKIVSGGEDRWMENDIPLLLQGVEEGDELQLRVKLYAPNINDCTCIKAVHLYYVDVGLRASVLRQLIFCA